jgi:hypothetical protein
MGIVNTGSKLTAVVHTKGSQNVGVKKRSNALWHGFGRTPRFPTTQAASRGAVMKNAVAGDEECGGWCDLIHAVL